MISDFIEKNFSTFRNDEDMFKKDEPFKPFQVLLMILPPSSKKLIPDCYHSVFEDLKEFYPEKFSLDFNGKRNPWEALVILPFVKSEVVVEAERKIYNSLLTDKSKLSDSERERNERGNNHIYSYDENSKYTSFITKFKSFEAQSVKVKRSVFDLYIHVKTNLDKNYDQKIVAYNFPTLNYIEYKSFLDEKKEKFRKTEIWKVKPISQNNMLDFNEKMFEQYVQGIMKKEDTVFFDCPFRREAYLQAIITPQGYYYLDKKNVAIDKNYRSDNIRRSQLKGFYFEQTNYLCEVFPLKCIARNSDGTLLKIYEVYPWYIPIEVTSFNSRRPEEFKKLKDDYNVNLYEKSKNIQTEIPLGVKVILLNKSHYGQFGIVHAYINKSNHSNYSQLNEKNYNKINYDEQFNYDLTKDDYFKNIDALYKESLIEVKVNQTSQTKLETDSQFAKKIIKDTESTYISLDDLGRLFNISTDILKLITTSIPLTTASSDMISLEKVEIEQYDIGLNLLSGGLILPGYTMVKFIDKSEYGMRIEYSEEAIKILRYYQEKFGWVFDSLKRYKEFYKISEKYFKVSL